MVTQKQCHKFPLKNGSTYKLKQQTIFTSHSPRMSGNKKIAMNRTLTYRSHNKRTEENKFRSIQKNGDDESENQTQRVKEHKNFQVLLRESLKRGRTARINNQSRLTEMNDYHRYTKSERKFTFNTELDHYLQINQLEGKKCKINSPKITPFSRSKANRSKSEQNRLKKQQQQLTILTQKNNEYQEQIKGIKMRKQNQKSTIEQSDFSSPRTAPLKSKPMIVTSTNLFLFVTPETNKQQNNNNFIRGKKKTKTLNKKVQMLHKQYEQQTQNIVNSSRILQFQNIFSHRMSRGIEGVGQMKRQQKKKQQQTAKIQGWEVIGANNHQEIGL